MHSRDTTMISIVATIALALLGCIISTTGESPHSGYCNWGPNGDAASSVCDQNIQGGDWCNQDQKQCETCGGRWCTNSGGPSRFRQANPNTQSPAEDGIASSTRYWDCMGGACGCSYIPGNQSILGTRSHCPSNAMFVAPADNVYGAKFYGAAAVSKALGGGLWMAKGCGKCWKLTAASNIPGYDDGNATTIVVKASNYCPPTNPLCAEGHPHFDIAAPGFDVLEYSLAHNCPRLEPKNAEGFAAGSTWMIRDPNPDANCDCSKFVDSVLRAGCENFYSLKWNNPRVRYTEVDCPDELSRLHCSWLASPQQIPETCASNQYPGQEQPATSGGSAFVEVIQ